MAKTLTGTTRRASLVWGATKTGNPRVRDYSLDGGTIPDDTDALRPHARTGTALASPAPRDLTAAELAMTVQAFMDSCDTAHTTAEVFP